MHQQPYSSSDTSRDKRWYPYVAFYNNNVKLILEEEF
jgi:hypothetical protein